MGGSIGAGVAVSVGTGSGFFVSDGSTLGAFDAFVVSVAVGSGLLVSSAASITGGVTVAGWVAVLAAVAVGTEAAVVATGNADAARPVTVAFAVAVQPVPASAATNPNGTRPAMVSAEAATMQRRETRGKARSVREGSGLDCATVRDAANVAPLPKQRFTAANGVPRSGPTL